MLNIPATRSHVETVSVPARGRRALLTALALVAAALFALLCAPQMAAAQIGVANSEVSWSEDGKVFAPIGDPNDVPWAVISEEHGVTPGKPPLVISAKMRMDTASAEQVSFVIGVDYTKFGSTTQNGKDLTFAPSVDGVKLPAIRAEDLFAAEPPYEGEPHTRLLTVPNPLPGSVNSVHEVTLAISLPLESTNESQGVRFTLGAIAVPVQIPTTDPAPTTSSAPSTTPVTTTAAPTALPTASPTPDPTVTTPPESTPTPSTPGGLADTGAGDGFPVTGLAGLGLLTLGACAVALRARQRSSR